MSHPVSSPPEQSEKRFHELLDAVLDYAICRLDADGRVATWNSGAERLEGYAPDEIIGQHFSIFHTAEDRNRGWPDRMLETVRRAGRLEDEGWRVRKDGSRFWANVVITSLRDDQGNVTGFAKVTRDLTAKREADEKLRFSEERLRLLIESVGDYALYMLDPEGRVTTWNLGAQRLKGYTAAEIVGQPFSTFFPPEDVAAGKPWRELEEARIRGRFEDEGIRVRKDGSRFWANASLSPMRDAQGRLVGFVKITRDLTERHAAEENARNLLREQTARLAAEEGERKLRESEERYRALSSRLEIVLEGVADGITVQSPSGALLYANSAAARLCGFESAEALLAATPAEIMERFEVLDENGRPFKPESLPGRRVLAGDPSASALLYVRERATGKHWWSLVRAGAVLGVDGKPELAVNIWHDVTAQHRSERDARYAARATLALGSSTDDAELLSAFARVLVPGLADWVTVYLRDGDHLGQVVSLHADPAKAALVEVHHRRFPPKPDAPGIWSVVRSGAPELHQGITGDAPSTSSYDPEQLASLRSLGVSALLAVPIVLHSKVIGAISLAASESGPRYDESHVELVQELAERAAVALDRASLFRSARAAAKLAEDASRAKDEFLATVSHELRTPLSAILGWASILKDRVTDPAIAKPIQVIHRNAQTQVAIIDDILDVSRVITGKFRIEPRPVDVVKVARDAVEVVRPSAVAKSVSLELDFESELCLLVADAERLQQVVWNLLSNAVKFTPANGTIRLSVRQEASQVVLRVSDTGAGIEPAFLPFVFDRFRQADPTRTRRVGGLGLGLALVRHIVELHGGHAEAASEGLGKGSTFTISLPIQAVKPAEAELLSGRVTPTTTPVTPALLAGRSVLVVDDEEDARDLVATVLEGAGARIQTARSVAETLAILERTKPDALVSDIAMPDEDGYTLIQRIRSLPGRADLPVLALTAYARDEDRATALNAGFDGHLGKPTDPGALVAMLVEVTKRRERPAT